MINRVAGAKTAARLHRWNRWNQKATDEGGGEARRTSEIDSLLQQRWQTMSLMYEHCATLFSTAKRIARCLNCEKGSAITLIADIGTPKAQRKRRRRVRGEWCVPLSQLWRSVVNFRSGGQKRTWFIL